MICSTKTKLLMTLFLLVEIKLGDCMPQGFFTQGFSIPKLVSSLPNIKIESPVKSSLFTVFGKKNTVNNKESIDKSKHQLLLLNAETIGQGTKELKTGQNGLSDNGSEITNQDKRPDQDNQDIKLPSVPRDEEELVSKLNAIDENATYNELGYTEVTTEYITETTTDDYDTTTLDWEPLNRSSPQLVASLLG